MIDPLPKPVLTPELAAAIERVLDGLRLGALPPIQSPMDLTARAYVARLLVKNIEALEAERHPDDE